MIGNFIDRRPERGAFFLRTTLSCDKIMLMEKTRNFIGHEYGAGIVVRRIMFPEVAEPDDISDDKREAVVESYEDYLPGCIGFDEAGEFVIRQVRREQKKTHFSLSDLIQLRGKKRPDLRLRVGSVDPEPVEEVLEEI